MATAGILPRDANFVTAVGGTSSATDSAASIRPFQYDPDTRGILVQIVGDDVGIGGGTQYTEDAAAAANPIGNAVILIRTDTPATQVTTDGDNVAQRGTNYGAAYVQLVTSAGAYIDSVGGGTEYTEDVATANPQVGKAIMMERDDALSSVTPIEGDWIGLRGTAEGALWTQDFNSDAILADTAALVVDAAAIEVLLGTIDADTGGILTAVQLIDNAISGAGFNITQFNGAAVPIGAGLEATALRVTIATDSTGVVSIDDNGGIITVDGTVTANLGATDNAVLDAIEVDTTTIAGAVSGTEMQVDIVAVTPDLMLGTDFSAVFGTDTVIGPTGGVVVEGNRTHDATDTGNPIKIGGYAKTAAPTNVSADGDRVNAWFDLAGRLQIGDGGGSLTVDGTVTANAGTDLNTSALLTTTAHDAAFGTAGTADTQVRSIQGIASMTPVQVVGSVADDATTPGDPVMVGGFAVSPDGTTPGAVAEADVARFRTDLNRRLLVNDDHPGWWSYHENSSSALTDAAVAADPGDGFMLVITYIQVSTGAATAFNFFLEETTTTIWGPVYLEAINGRGYVTPAGFKKHVTASTALTITTSAAILHSVEILGYIQAV